MCAEVYDQNRPLTLSLVCIHLLAHLRAAPIFVDERRPHGGQLRCRRRRVNVGASRAQRVDCARHAHLDGHLQRRAAIVASAISDHVCV